MSNMKNATIETEISKSLSGVLKECNTVTEDVSLVLPDGVQTAQVTVTCQITKNMGNYNSLKVGVTVSTPTLPEHVEKATAALEDYVKTRALALLTPKDAK